MDLKSCSIKGISFIVVTLFLIAIITIAQNAPKHGHIFMSDPNKCEDCHLGEPVFGETDYRDLSFTDDIVTLCHRCHSEESLGRSHPVNITPRDDMRIPEDLHLDENMNMTCATCHQPHGEPYTQLKPTDYVSAINRTRDRLYRSYYLRRTNIQNALCYSCHNK